MIDYVIIKKIDRFKYKLACITKYGGVDREVYWPFKFMAKIEGGLWLRKRIRQDRFSELPPTVINAKRSKR